MDIEKRSIRLDDEVMERLKALPGKTINDGLRYLLIEGDSLKKAVLETLELVRGQLDAEQVRSIVEEVMQQKIDARAAAKVNPTSIPGVQVGAQGLQLEAKYHRSDGSRMSFAERREVDLKARVSEIAAQDTAAAAVARTDIEYDP